MRLKKDLGLIYFRFIALSLSEKYIKDIQDFRYLVQFGELSMVKRVYEKMNKEIFIFIDIRDVFGIVISRLRLVILLRLYVNLVLFKIYQVKIYL